MSDALTTEPFQSQQNVLCTGIGNAPDGRSCPETISLSVKDNQLPVYQEMATFPCGGHLIGWRTTGAIPNYNIFLGVWIPNYGTQKLLTLLEPLNKTSGGEMEPLIIESGDFMGLVLLNDSISSSSKLDQRPQQAQTPHSLTSAYTKNKLLVAVVPRNTTRGSVLNFEKISFHLIPAEFTLHVQMDYTGIHKTKWESTKKLNKRDKSTKCSLNLPNCESCIKIKGKLACSQCRDGFYGKTCKNTCPESCSSCEQKSGDCIRCATEYFGPSCKEQCPTGCAPSLGCNAVSGCVQCRLGWGGMWCKQFTQSCDEGRFRGSNCKDQCPENCEACNGTQVNEVNLVCKRGVQWQLCADVVANNHESENISEGGSSSLGGILGALFALIILGAIVAGVVYYLVRRRRRNSAKRQSVLEALNGLPSRNVLDRNERPCNTYVEDFTTTANQNRRLPLPPGEDEEGYMAPQTKPDVTSRLLQEEELSSNDKPSTSEAARSSPQQDDVYEVIGDVEPIEETFE
eukprot:XP_019930529.1 PREDICTED: uncharacterized protein LOC105347365 [Crassostrea gigas]